MHSRPTQNIWKPVKNQNDQDLPDFLSVTSCRAGADGTPPTFSKFEEKKNMEKGRRINTMRRLFWGGPSPPKAGRNIINNTIQVTRSK